MKLEFSQQLSETILKYQTAWKSGQWEASCTMRTDRRTDGQEERHDEANSRFSQFCERAKKKKKTKTNAHLQNFNFPQTHFAEAYLLHPYILLNTLLSDTLSVLPFEWQLKVSQQSKSKSNSF